MRLPLNFLILFIRFLTIRDNLTLFAVPWRKEDGTANHLRIRRLKDKLGVRAVPSGEVEFEGALAYVVGEQNKGIYYMLEALNLSRICKWCCARRTRSRECPAICCKGN